MRQAQVTNTEMARRMETSRAQLDRLLDPSNDKVQIDTIEKAARAIGKVLKVELVDAAWVISPIRSMES
jgi:antitoxin HicB